MLPSLLAAFSAPNGVSVLPSCFASSALTAARAGVPDAARNAATISDEEMRSDMLVGLLVVWDSEGVENVERDEVAVRVGVAALATELLGVVDAALDSFGAAVREVQADGDRPSRCRVHNGGGLVVGVVAEVQRHGQVEARKCLVPGRLDADAQPDRGLCRVGVARSFVLRRLQQRVAADLGD